MKIEVGTITRTVLLILALINQVLTVSGHSVLPITDEQMTDFITTVFTAATALAAWWKNNSFTSKAIAADTYKKNL